MAKHLLFAVFIIASAVLSNALAVTGAAEQDVNAQPTLSTDLVNEKRNGDAENVAQLENVILSGRHQPTHDDESPEFVTNSVRRFTDERFDFNLGDFEDLQTSTPPPSHSDEESTTPPEESFEELTLDTEIKQNERKPKPLVQDERNVYKVASKSKRGKAVAEFPERADALRALRAVNFGTNRTQPRHPLETDFEIMASLYDQSQWNSYEIVKSVGKTCGIDMDFYLNGLFNGDFWSLRGEDIFLNYLKLIILPFYLLLFQ